MALEDLLRIALKKAWGDTRVIAEASTAIDSSVVLEASLEKIRRLLAKALKPGRKLVNIVTFADGRMREESVASSEGLVGVTVAAPRLGCPEPVLAAAELRAREVLFAFLAPEQQESFLQHNAFISQGVGTGHRYMITSRHARGRLAHHRRQLFDLDEERPFCVHDYMVPAAEEMLALHVLLQLPAWERYLRHLE